MKATSIVAFFMASFACYAVFTLEDISPHFSKNTQIIWKAPMDDLPKSLWTYRKLPTVFSAAMISNAIILASFQDKGFPKPSSQRVVIWGNQTEGEPEPPYFSILPDVGEMDFTMGDRAPQSEDAYFKNAAAVDRAWAVLARLGMDRSEFVKTNVATSGEFGVFLPRKVDGIPVFGECGGFSLQQFGNPVKISGFSLLMPKLERIENVPIASPQQIMACIRAHKTPVSPPLNEEFNYFDRIEALATARKFTIAKVTPLYADGVFGETPTNGEPAKVMMPLAQLDAVADMGGSNMTVRLLSPIIASEANRLLKSR